MEQAKYLALDSDAKMAARVNAMQQAAVSQIRIAGEEPDRDSDVLKSAVPARGIASSRHPAASAKKFPATKPLYYFRVSKVDTILGRKYGKYISASRRRLLGIAVRSSNTKKKA